MYLLLSEKHTCGHGLIGRDAGHGDSVSRSLVREASSKGSLQKTVSEITLQVSDILSVTSLYGESGKGLSLMFYTAIFKIKLSPSQKCFTHF